MSRLPRAVGAAIAALAIGACHNDKSNPTPGISLSALVVSVSPNPITTIQSNPAGPTWSVSYTVTVKETAGLGGKIELIAGSLYDDATGQLLARNQYDSQDLVVFVGENRVEAHGSLDIRQDLTYIATATRPTSVVIALRFRDDHGNLLEPSLLVKAN